MRWIARRALFEVPPSPFASRKVQRGHGAGRRSIAHSLGAAECQGAGFATTILTAGVPHGDLDAAAFGFRRMLAGHHPGRRLQAGNSWKYHVEGPYDIRAVLRTSFGGDLSAQSSEARDRNGRRTAGPVR